jgi:hypothetical protein
VLVLDVDFESIDVLVGADTLDAEKEIIVFAIELPLVQRDLFFFMMCLLIKVGIIVIWIGHRIIYVLILLIRLIWRYYSYLSDVVKEDAALSKLQAYIFFKHE